VRKYVLQRRGILSTATMRKPAPAFSAETRADVDYLLARLAKHDPRAKV
jgi:4-hydroxy-tetrahydrodipicolinate synthase